jgi:hypothetical protein
MEHMEVLAVTLFLSLLLAVFFVVLFLGSHRASRRSVEQDALMPLDDSGPPRRAPAPGTHPQARG